MNSDVHVAVTRTVKPGCEADFEQAIRSFFADSLAEPGTVGAHLLRPLPGSNQRTYGILRSFAGPAYRDAFYASDAFRRWEQTVAPWVEGDYVRRELHGLEAFFRGGAAVSAPPRWKMAIATWLGVWPSALAFSTLLGPPLQQALPGWAASGVVSACVVAALTWAVMPLLVKVLHGWLHGPRPGATP